jgi:hypothetical protein
MSVGKAVPPPKGSPAARLALWVGLVAGMEVVVWSALRLGAWPLLLMD